MPKKSNISSTARGYFHNLNPYALHARIDLANSDRSRISKFSNAKKRSPRVSTFYTILQDGRKNNPTKFGNVPQGPHTFPHHGIHQGIIAGMQKKQLNLFGSIIPSPIDYGKRVDSEIPVGHKKRPRAEIAKTIYAKRHARYLRLSGKSSRNELEDIAFAHVINKLIQMDPHGSYAYKGSGASYKALRGKGESTLKPLANQIDLPSNSGLTHVSSVHTRSKSLLNTLQGLGVT